MVNEFIKKQFFNVKRQAVKVRNRMALTKVYVGRASSYMSLINTAMITPNMNPPIKALNQKLA